jgi:hypothetical protein
MSGKSQRGKLAPLSEFLIRANSPALGTENAKELDCLLVEIKRAIKPKDFIEELYVTDYATIQWDAQCLRRSKRSFIDMELTDQCCAHLREIIANFEAKKQNPPRQKQSRAARRTKGRAGQKRS